MKKAVMILMISAVAGAMFGQEVTRTIDNFRTLDGYIQASVKEQNGEGFAVILFRDNDYQAIFEYESLYLTPENFRQFAADYKAMIETKAKRGESYEWRGENYLLIRSGLNCMFQGGEFDKLIPICGRPKKLVPFLERNLKHF